jgi:hypothetical protein
VDGSAHRPLFLQRTLGLDAAEKKKVFFSPAPESETDSLVSSPLFFLFGL